MGRRLYRIQNPPVAFFNFHLMLLQIILVLLRKQHAILSTAWNAIAIRMYQVVKSSPIPAGSCSQFPGNFQMLIRTEFEHGSSKLLKGTMR